MAISDDLKQRILLAIYDTTPGPTGAITRADLMKHSKLSGEAYMTIDRTLPKLQQAGLAEYLGKRNPKTGQIRKRWGWFLTDADRKALTLKS